MTTLLAQVDQEELLDLADRHRVAMAVGSTLLNYEELQPAARERLITSTRLSAIRHLLLEAEMLRVAEVLDAIPWLVVKGPALARGHYRRPELRSYTDLDILVPPDRLAGALEAFETAGYALLDRNWTLLAQRMAGELHLTSPRGAVIDLHWDLFNDRATRDSYDMDTSSFFTRSTPLAVREGTEIRTLDALDTMVHTAVHAARSGGDRLVWMKDLEQLVLARPYSWDELAVRSAEHHAQLPVTVMLQRMTATLRVPDVTDAALRGIGGPRIWRKLGRGVDRVSSVTGAGADGSLARMYARATRADSRTTVRELGRRLTARARRGAWTELDVTWDASHPESVLYDSGGPATREVFLNAVASGRRPSPRST